MSSHFEQVLLPHLAAAYNLARWLIHDAGDAEDVVQEAYLRALRFFASFRGGDARAWLLAIVRNTSYDWMRQHRAAEADSPFDEERHTPADRAATPETTLLERVDRDVVRAALEALPPIWREVIVLRELEGLSYKEIAEVVGIPMGTVMSRLARARSRLHQELSTALEKE